MSTANGTTAGLVNATRAGLDGGTTSERAGGPAAGRAGGKFLIGLIGTGIGPSLTPPLHEHEGDACGVRYLYRRLDLDQLGLEPAAVGDLLAAVRLARYDGLNVTHPCKQLVLEHLDELSPDAAALGAVNTVVFRDGRAIGHNTDWSGFANGFRRGLPGAALGRVVLLGAGGAGSAVGHALLAMGTERLTVVDIDAGRAARLAQALEERFGPGRAVAGERASLVAALYGADGLVHATPVGMAETPGLPLPTELLNPGLWVADVVYRPLETELVRTARQAGCRVLNGGRMAVFQAAGSFRLFTGIEPDTDRMLADFAELVERPDVAVPAG